MDVDAVTFIRYYLDKYETGSMSSFSAGAMTGNASAAFCIIAVYGLFEDLKRSSAFFRLKVNEDNAGKIVSVPRMIYDFVVEHVCRSRKGVEERYPKLFHMIAATTSVGRE